MILRIIRLKIFLLLLFLNFSLIVFSQTKMENQKFLLGRWMLEDVIPSDDISSMHTVEIDSCLKPCSEIIIRQEGMTFRYNNTDSEKGKYILKGNVLFFNINSKSIGYEWAISDNKLYLEGSQDITDDDGKQLTLVAIFVYKRQ